MVHTKESLELLWKHINKLDLDVGLSDKTYKEIYDAIRKELAKIKKKSSNL